MNITDVPEQCVVLVGGLGSRLGILTHNCPKPLLEFDGKPFLDVLITRLQRFGFNRILLLAGFKGEQLTQHACRYEKKLGIRVDVLVESYPLGTAGALLNAADLLDSSFLVLNGDSLFDFNWLDLVPFSTKQSCLVAMSLRCEPETSRFGVVEVENDYVSRFHERGGPGPGLINGGVYLISRDILPLLPKIGSLERDVLPAIACKGLLRGRAYDSAFIDIGIPETYAQASEFLRQNAHRGAVFLDRDGVINVDYGYVHRIDQFQWISGAIEAIKLVNDSGYYLFVVTNQAGIARGYYEESDVIELHNYIQSELRLRGAHIDDIRYCPFHVDGKIQRYKKVSSDRKPGSGMIIDLMKYWSIAKEKSMLIGDKSSDILAAESAGIDAHQFDGRGNLKDFIAPLL